MGCDIGMLDRLGGVSPGKHSRGAGPVSSVLSGGKDSHNPSLCQSLGKEEGRSSCTEIPNSDFYRRLTCSAVLRNRYLV